MLNARYGYKIKLRNRGRTSSNTTMKNWCMMLGNDILLFVKIGRCYGLRPSYSFWLFNFIERGNKNMNNFKINFKNPQIYSTRWTKSHFNLLSDEKTKKKKHENKISVFLSYFCEFFIIVMMKYLRYFLNKSLARKGKWLRINAKCL